MYITRLVSLQNYEMTPNIYDLDKTCTRSPYDVRVLEVVQLFQRRDLSHRTHRHAELLGIRRDSNLLERDESPVLEVSRLVDGPVRSVPDQGDFFIDALAVLVARVDHGRRHRRRRGCGGVVSVSLSSSVIRMCHT